MINDSVRTAGLNFAGFYGPVAPSVMAGYAVLAALFLGAAAAGHRFRARLEEW